MKSETVIYYKRAAKLIGKIKVKNIVNIRYSWGLITKKDYLILMRFLK